VSRARAELVVAGLLVLAALLAAGFVAAYALDLSTPVLGLAIGLALAALGFAAAVASSRVVPQLEREEPLPWRRHEQEVAETVELVEAGADGITRRRLLGVAAGGAAAAVGTALAVPALSLGPGLDPDVLRRSPWRAGRRLVDERGRPLTLDSLEIGSYAAAFPEGAERELVGSPLAVVRLDPGELDPPPGREGWDAEGVLAFSSICTHAGCAVTLFRHPSFEPTSPEPALVCPCHYSTFDVRRGAEVVFGPAGRPLPQLPLRVEQDGTLAAGGPLSSSPGPSWWGVRR
jgi:ubiquinol-cytochrome c reductase iron-sulfur subunit